MAEEPAQEGVAAASPRKKKLVKLLAIIGGVAVLQAIGFFVVFKMASGGPEAAHGADSHAIDAAPTTQPTVVSEVRLLKSFKVPNDKSGVLRIYDMDISIIVPDNRKADAEKLAEQRAAEIGDTVARIVRGATDRMLREDDLRVLRAQFLEGLREIAGDETLIQRVLIPKFVPIRAE